MEKRPRKFTVEIADKLRKINFDLRQKRKILKILEDENPDIAVRTDDNVSGDRVYPIFQQITALRVDIKELEEKLQEIQNQ